MYLQNTTRNTFLFFNALDINPKSEAVYFCSFFSSFAFKDSTGDRTDLNSELRTLFASVTGWNF